MKTVEERLARAARAPVADVERAQARFAKRAEKEGLMDVAYAPVDSPFGELIVASTPKGLVLIELAPARTEFVLDHLSRAISPRILKDPRKVDDVRRQLDEYFAGKRHTFELPLDWQLSHGFAQRVLRATARIPYGKVSSYRAMAEKAGNVRATRAAGNALGSNPIPIVVPCHRVLRTGGGLGGYGGGLPMKEALLKLEGALLS